jgi:two-component system, NarL family, sensor kinase
MKNDLTSLVIIGISAMLLLTVGVMLAVLFTFKKKSQHRKALQDLKEQQQNQLIEAAVRSEETERHRIAETLHDEVGAILSSAKLHLLGIKAETLDEKDKKLHEKGGGLLNNVIQKVRGISHNLHSNILKEFGFNEAVKHFLKDVAGETMPSVATDLDDNYPADSTENDISLYRMIQELVNNILKYANATELTISSVLHQDKLSITIFHNGNGLDQREFEEMTFKKEGLGLKNIKNRIMLLKGSILFEKQQNGYYTYIHMPFTNKPLLNEKDKISHSG